MYNFHTCIIHCREKEEHINEDAPKQPQWRLKNPTEHRAGASLFGVVRPRDWTGLQLLDSICHGMQTIPKLCNLEIYKNNGCPKIELGNYLVIGSCNTFVYWLYYQLWFNSCMYVMLQSFKLSTTVFFPNDFLGKL